MRAPGPLSTAAGVLLIVFEACLMLGLAWSLAAMVWRRSHPHVAEVKGFVMDRLKAAGFEARFAGRQFMTAQEAWEALLQAKPAS